MSNPLVVKIGWDDDAKVWVATSDDIRGLAVEGDSLDKLHAKIMDALHDLIELNGFEHEGDQVPVELLTEASVNMARCA